MASQHLSGFPYFPIKLIKATLTTEKLHFWAETINRYVLTIAQTRWTETFYSSTGLTHTAAEWSNTVQYWVLWAKHDASAWVEGTLVAACTHACTRTHTRTRTERDWYFLALPVSSIRIITHKKSRANIWSTPHTAAAPHQEQPDTSVHIKKTGNKTRKNNKCIKAAHSCPFQTEPRRDRWSRAPDCDPLASSRNSQGRARLCCQIQQLNCVHDDADWRKCLGFLCKHWGSSKNFAHLRLFS